MCRRDEFCEEIIRYFKEEAIPKNYSTLIMEMDLGKKLALHTKYLEDWYNESLRDSDASYDDGYEEGKEEGYSDGYSDGESAGKEEGKKEFILLLADKLINFKQWLMDHDPSKKEIQIKISEILIEMDDNNEILYTPKEIKLKEIDSVYDDEH